MNKKAKVAIVGSGKRVRMFYGPILNAMKDEFEFEEYLLKRITWRQHVTNPKKFKEFETEIMDYVEKSEELAFSAGIQHEFLQKETEKVIDAVDNYIKAAEKRGI